MKEKIEDILFFGALALMVLGVAIVLFEGFGGADWLIERAEAASSQTTVEVIITDEMSSNDAQVWAQVPCNEVNCPEATTDVEVQEISLWGRFVTWLGGLW